MNKKYILIFIFIFVDFSICFAQTPIQMVFDQANFLKAVDSFYQGYDSLMNTITMIEQNYQQLKMAIEEARTWNWEEVQWDGDLDFRNEIRGAVKQVDRLIQREKKIRTILTQNKITCGGQSYTITDLVGLGVEGKNIVTVAKDIGKDMGNSLSNAAESWSKKLTEEETQYIWQKYGLSASSYYEVKQIDNLLSKQMEKLIISATDEAKQIKTDEMEARKNKILDMIMNSSYGKEIDQKTALLYAEMISQLNQFSDQWDDIAGFIATQEKDRKKEEERLANEKLQVAQDAEAKAKTNNVNEEFAQLGKIKEKQTSGRF